MSSIFLRPSNVAIFCLAILIAGIVTEQMDIDWVRGTVFVPNLDIKQ